MIEDVSFMYKITVDFISLIKLCNIGLAND